MFQKFSRNLGSLRLSIAVLAGMAIVVAAVSCSVNTQNLGSKFTKYSGAKFAEPSDDLDVPYEPTAMAVVNAMLNMASMSPKDFLIDLGSGDGRIVITAAKRFGAHGFGVDLNPKLVELSIKYAKDMGVADRVAFHVQDLFMTDISKADVVTMYLVQEVNLKLRPKLLSDLKPGTRVVSHDFHMGEWRPDKTVIIPRKDRKESLLYLWVIPAKVAGKWQSRIPMPGGEQSFNVELNQDFQDIGGVAWNKNGKWRLFDAAVEGKRISFSLVSEADDRMIRQDYEGRVKSNVIEGTVTLSGGVKETRFQWRATRTETRGEMWK
jgi:SAM-dependent methyltransferase